MRSNHVFGNLVSMRLQTLRDEVKFENNAFKLLIGGSTAGMSAVCRGINMNDLNLTDKVMNSMIEYNRGDARRIQHAVKVYEFAALLGRMEGISPKEQQVLEIAAVLHDIGIHICEQKYGNCDGRNQEIEGPGVAKAILENIMGSDADEAFVGRVCYLIGHHHTYTGVTGMDYQLLIEADFLVNALEEGLPEENIRNVRAQIFKSEAGKKLLDEMFAL